MGKGFLKERHRVRAAQFNQMVRYAKGLEAQNKQLKTDPSGVVGQFLNKLELLSLQNNKLSALSAALIQIAGGTVQISKELIESFGNHRVTIKVAGNADKDEDVTSYEFTYEKVSVPDQSQVLTAQQAAPDPTATITVEGGVAPELEPIEGEQ